MLQRLLNLFKTDADPQLTKLRKLTVVKGFYSKLNEDEQTFLMLRLADKSKQEIAVALNTTVARLDQIEAAVIKRLSKA